MGKAKSIKYQEKETARAFLLTSHTYPIIAALSSTYIGTAIIIKWPLCRLLPVLYKAVTLH